MIQLIVISFFIFYLISVIVSENNIKDNNVILILSCGILTILIGIRENWPDQGVYVMAFNNVPKIFNITANDVPFGYAEYGYMYLASLIKTIYNNELFYLLVMGGISMLLLYKSLTKYCVFPLIGLCNYICRFLMNRDFVQMRSSLAILLIIYATQYIYEKKMWKYMLVVLLAYQFHHLSLLGIPIYFLCQFNINRKQIISILLFAFISSQLLSTNISSFVETWSDDLNYTTYTQGVYVEKALGLRNPMIYFQLIILLFFMYFEDILKNEKYYYVLRTGYFYSTFILILFCNNLALSGRTSTLFATFEIFIIPLITKSLSRGFVRYLFYIGIGVVFLYFIYNKYITNYVIFQNIS